VYNFSEIQPSEWLGFGEGKRKLSKINTTIMPQNCTISTIFYLKNDQKEQIIALKYYKNYLIVAWKNIE